MKHQVANTEIDKIVEEAQAIAAGDYKKAEITAKNHAALQARMVMINAELIKTIRHLDAKNSKLQNLVFWLSVIATIATLVALLK